jgi:1-acyl-sn-glycerol-3-phosphate acyltransferase
MDLSSIFSAESSVPSRVPASIWTRLHAVWLVLWTTVLMIPFSIGVVAACRRNPGLDTFKRWVERYAGYGLRGAGIQVETIGRSRLDPDQPYIFVSNHQCALDILVHGVGIPHPFGYLAKENLRHAPILGYVLEHTPSILVDTTHPVRAVESLKKAGAQVADGHSLLVYAEGERTFSSELLPFRRGAFMLAITAGVPIVPVTLIDSYRLLDERVLRSRPGTVHLHIGDPISVEGVTKEDIPGLIETIRGQMHRLLQGESAETQPA